MERSVFGMMLAKIESTYAADPTPTAAANLIAVTRSGWKFAPKFEHLTRSLLDGTLSKVAGTNVLPEVDVDFDVEIRGNRTNGTAPDISAGAVGQLIEIDPLLRCCDLSPTYTAELTSGSRDGYVIYAPVVPSTQGESVTLYLYTGLKKHIITGCKGTVKGIMEAGKFGLLSFSLKGIYNNAADASIPGSQTWLNTKPPVFISSGSTIASYSPVFSRLEFDLGATVSKRLDANSATGVAGFMITDRASKVTIDPESVAEATNPIWGDLEAATARLITGKIGTQAGNKFQGAFEGVSEAVAYGERSGIRTQSISYMVERATIDAAESAAFQLKFY